MLPQYAYDESTGVLVVKSPELDNQDNCLDYEINNLWRVHNWIQRPQVGTSD